MEAGQLERTPKISALDAARAFGIDGGVSVAALIRQRATQDPGRSYVEHARSDALLTFGQLEDTVDRWHRVFAEAGVHPGTTVALAVADPVEFAGIFLSGIAAGLWVAPLDPASPVRAPDGLDALATRVGADLVLADRAAPADLDLQWHDVSELLAGVRAGHVVAGPATRLGGVVLSSSGTTGSPKVIRLDQHQLLHAARYVVAHHRLGAADRGFNSLPLFHINAEVVGLLSALLAGSCLVLDDRFHRTGFWELMAARSISWINAVPAIVSRVADLRPGEQVPSGIRFIRSASAPLPVATADRMERSTGIPVIESYGMTEAASQIAAHPLDAPRRPGSVGRPVGVELRIVDPDEPVGGSEVHHPGAVGHVEIRGVSVVDAYEGGDYGDRFDAEGWLRTGDLGHFDADGFLYLDARTDDVINRGGEKVFPREIEEVITTVPGVVSVAVVGREDPELGQVPVAYVVVRDADGPDGLRVADATAERIGAVLEQKLVRSKRPVALCVVRAMPAGATGKVRRRALGDPDVPILRTYAYA